MRYEVFAATWTNSRPERPLSSPSWPLPVIYDQDARGAVVIGEPKLRLPGTCEIKTGKRSSVLIRVNRTGKTDRIEVFFDEQRVGEWSGDRESIASSKIAGYATAERVGIWVPRKTKYTFHRIRVRMLDGKLEKLRA